MTLGAKIYASAAVLIWLHCSAPASSIEILPSHGGYSANGSNSQGDDTASRFQAAADRSQDLIARCGAAAACVAQELDHYADWIENAAPELPPQLNGLPAIIRRASGAIRVARTRIEASRAVNTAIEQVRKTITESAGAIIPH